MNSRLRAGFNLVEAAIVLGVIGLVIGGIWVAAAAVQENYRQSKTLEQVLSIASNLTQVYKGIPITSTSFLSDTSNSGIWGSVFPVDMVVSNSIRTPYNSLLSLRITNTRSAVFGINFSRVSQCASLAPRLYAGIKHLQTSADAFMTANDGLPLDTPSAAATSCQTEFNNNGSADISFSITIPN